MTQHSAIYLTPFSHRLAEEIDNPEYQRLRCRVNYHALRFKLHIMKLSDSIVDKPRSHGHFMSIHLRFEMDMLAFAGYAPFQRLWLPLYYHLIYTSATWELLSAGALTYSTLRNRRHLRSTVKKISQRKGLSTTRDVLSGSVH